MARPGVRQDKADQILRELGQWRSRPVPGLSYPSSSPVARIMTGGRSNKKPEAPDKYRPDHELSALDALVSSWKRDNLKMWVVINVHYFLCEGYGMGPESRYIAAGCGRAMYFKHLCTARRLVSAWRKQYQAPIDERLTELDFQSI